MPELPEVESLRRFLDARVAGRTIDSCRLASFAALKTYDPPLDALTGLRLSGCSRHGKFLDLEAPPLHLVIHLARAGWIRWSDQLDITVRAAGRSPVALRVRLDDGSGLTLTEQGTEKRVSVHVVRDPVDVPGIAGMGADPLSPSFDLGALGDLLNAAGARPIKSLLTDQHALAGVGNAYSDEILHEARLSPFKHSATLSLAEVATLHRSLVEVLAGAVQRASGLDASELKGDKRGALRVHGRTGLPCPVCGDTVREVSLASRAFQYCPTCQTDGKVLADRRLSRLLK